MSACDHAGIAACGITSHLGIGLDAHCAALKNGASASQCFPLEQFANVMDLTTNYLTVPHSPDDALAHLHFLIDQAMEDLLAKHTIDDQARALMPVFLGSSCYGIGVAEALYAEALAQGDSAIPLPLDGFFQISSYLHTRWGFTGPDFACNTACTASANALLSAASGINAGLYDQALVLGVEAYNLTTSAGFAVMQLLSPDKMRPFDKRRNGLTLGEGCAAILLTKDETGDLPVHVYGGASACDTYSISASNPDGSEIANVIEQALASADIKREQVNAIKAHGTASPLNDVAEAAAMRAVFGKNLPPFFCLKPAIGHTLGACGALEVALFTGFLERASLPASSGFSEADPELEGVTPSTHALAATPGFYMANFFGFGGNNSSLVLRYTPRGEAVTQ